MSQHSSEPPNPWAGYQRALESGLADSTSPSHVLVLQEDVQVCRNFAPAVERIAEAKPDEPVCLFLSWLPGGISKQAREALMLRQRYLRAKAAKFCPVVAVLWPVTAAERFLAWHPTDKLPGWPGPVLSDDAVLGHWIKRQGETIWIALPSLVEHPDMVDSVKGRNNSAWGRDKARSALHYIGDADPLDLDWA